MEGRYELNLADFSRGKHKRRTQAQAPRFWAGFSTANGKKRMEPRASQALHHLKLSHDSTMR